MLLIRIMVTTKLKFHELMQSAYNNNTEIVVVEIVPPIMFFKLTSEVSEL